MKNNTNNAMKDFVLDRMYVHGLLPKHVFDACENDETTAQDISTIHEWDKWMSYRNPMPIPTLVWELCARNLVYDIAVSIFETNDRWGPDDDDTVYEQFAREVKDKYPVFEYADENLLCSMVASLHDDYTNRPEVLTKKGIKDSMAVRELLDYCKKVDPNGEFTAQSILDDPEGYTEMLIRWWTDSGEKSAFASRHHAALDIIKGLKALGGEVDMDTFDRLVLQHAIIIETASKGDMSYELAEALNSVTGYTLKDDPYAPVKNSMECMLDLRKAWRCARSEATDKVNLEDGFIEALAYRLHHEFRDECYLVVTQEHLDSMWAECRGYSPLTKQHVKEAWKYLIHILCTDGTLLPGVNKDNFDMFAGAMDEIIDNYRNAIDELK